MKSWMAANRDAIGIGLLTSIIGGAVFWFLPAASDVGGDLGQAFADPLVRGLAGAALAALLGIGAGAAAYRFGQRSALEVEQSGLPSVPPTEPSPTAWPMFERDGLIADCKILVVDDSSPDKVTMFKRRGFDVTLRQKVEHNASSPYQDTFDLLFLDIRGVASDFGATKGTEALPLLRQDNPWLPILIFTSYPQDLRGQTREQVIDLADAIVKKSLRYDELEPQVLDLLQQRRQRAWFERSFREAGVSNTEQLIAGLVQGTDVEPRFAASDVSASLLESVRRTCRVAKRVLETARRRSSHGGAP